MSAMRTQKRKFGRIHLSLLTSVAAGSCILLGLWARTHSNTQDTHQTTHQYVASDYGGFVGADRTPQSHSPLQLASEAYANGKFIEAEHIANVLIQQTQGGRYDRAQEHVALLARRILAYSSARQHRFTEAKTRFEALRQAAYEGPDHGQQRVPVGDVAPTLEEESAFQEAVCTGALGDTGASEREYIDFIRRYPQSILIHAAVKRIGRLHGGDIPKEAETAWKEAMSVQKTTDDGQRRSEALCGPECLSELLRRQGRHLDVSTLAEEMHTTGEGTLLSDLQKTANRHGLKLQGVSLSGKGLAKQKLPLIALIAPGHYVLVDKVMPDQVSTWDPDLKGIGIGGKRLFSAGDWAKVWGGVALR